MAVTHWYTGRNSTTSATVVVRVDSTASVSVVCNGQTITQTCDTSVNDGNKVFEFTGLAAGQRYAYSITGATDGTGRLCTQPVAPTTAAPIWLALSSCWSIQKPDILALKLITAPANDSSRDTPMQALHRECVANLQGVFLLGDLIYQNITATVNGYAVVPMTGGTIANSKDVNQHRQYWRAQGLTPGLMQLMRNVPCYRLGDDHDNDPDNSCPKSLAWYQAAYAGGIEADRAAYEVATKTAWADWALGNPTYRFAENRYFTVRIGNTELFCTDNIWERSFYSDTDSGSKRMLSAAQEEAFLADMGGTSAAFKVWVNTKMMISACGRNADGWYNNPGETSEGYQTQLARILSDSRFPSAGAMVVTGDEHIKSDLEVVANRFGAGGKYITEIAGGPATIDVITNPNDNLNYTSGVLSKERDISGAARRGDNNYVLLRILPDRVERYMLGSRAGLVYMGYISTADNAVRR